MLAKALAPPASLSLRREAASTDVEGVRLQLYIVLMIFMVVHHFERFRTFLRFFAEF